MPRPSLKTLWLAVLLLSCIATSTSNAAHEDPSTANSPGKAPSSPVSQSDHSLMVWQNGGWQVRRGQILKIRGDGLQFHEKDVFTVKTYNFADVKSFEFGANAAYIKGQAASRAKRYEEAERWFEKSLDSESRDWAQAEILAQLASVLIADQRPAEAIPLFQKIRMIDDNSRHLGALPLIWDARLPAAYQVPLSKDQQLVVDEISRLVIASRELSDEKRQVRAKQTLQALKTSSKSLVLSQLADAQLWRLHLLNADSGSMLTDVWRSQWERMGPVSRSGPGYVLGRCLQKEHRYDDAAIVLLWSPLVQQGNRVVKALSLKAAAENLQKSGRIAEARRVAQTLIEGYPDLAAAVNFSEE